MSNLDLVEALPDDDVAKMGALYFLTAYLFPRDYKKVVDNYLFAPVEDFDAMNRFPWGKLLFDITLDSLKDGLSRRTPHYRLRCMLVAFQVWIYETFLSLDGIVVTRTSKTHPRIMNWMVDEQPSAAKLEGADCFANVDIVICDLEPSKTEMAMSYMNNVQYQKPIQPDLLSESRRKKRTKKSAGNASASGKSVILLTDSKVHGVGDKGTHVARGSDKTDEVQIVQPNVDRKEKGKIDPSEDISIPYSLQPPSFDLGIAYTQPDDVQKQVDSIISDVLTATKSVQAEGSTSPNGRSELPVKRVSRPARILQSPFVVGEGKLFKYDDHVIVFEYFKGDIEEVDRSTFMSKIYRDWKVLEGIEPYVKILPALMNALEISKKDPDYHRPDSKELKVYIDSTLP
ncbi:Hypothetical predicted protein [Olea europaea subsp. europaea]|uniref:DUF1985 domain-containing protein n=1 Tax=Olea europaea subsp. europaea TaxID=158383 RepID=A0A8S0TBV4_OLEEU|nr:Hypothetical predicted protein [Olea europaea subsp. europaea]